MFIPADLVRLINLHPPGAKRQSPYQSMAMLGVAAPRSKGLAKPGGSTQSKNAETRHMGNAPDDTRDKRRHVE